MKVCIAEKPSVAAEIAKVLGCSRRLNGYFTNDDQSYCVTWVFGHLCELKEPHEYDARFKSWRWDALPIIPERFAVKVREDEGVKRQFNTIKNLVSKAEEVINCGDAGQEGELIQRWVLQEAGMKCPMKRLWISSLTEEAIREGFQNLKPGSDFDSLFMAGYTRAVSDWLLGMNATRAYTLRYGGNGRGVKPLSIGRVQTPTLALIVERHLEIQNFKPEPFWELKTLYRGVTFNSTKGRFPSPEEANETLRKIEGQPLTINSIQTKQGTEAPPRLFDLTTLQVECNRKFGYSADDTLKYIQSLYEKKLTTYPRVDTSYLSDDIYPKIPQILKGISIPVYQPFIEPLLQAKIRKSKKVFDNSKVTDHHAIIPTGISPYNQSITAQEKFVYDLIARRFIANFHPDCEFSTTTVLADSNKVEFKTTGKQIIKPGFRVVLDQSSSNQKDEEPDNQILPDFTQGEQGPHEPSLLQKQTQPPKPYTEATLLRAMETAGKQSDDDEIRDLMKDNGIGRPSTRAAIIETLFKRDFIRREKKNIMPTPTGVALIATIRDEILKSVELTGQWEKELRNIERNKEQSTQLAVSFIGNMKQMVVTIIQNVYNDNSFNNIATLQMQAQQQAAQSKASKSETKKTTEKDTSNKKGSAAQTELLCPKCGKPMLKGNSAWGCSGYADGCSVRVPFQIYGKKITDTMLSQLLSKHQTSVVKGLLVPDASGTPVKTDAKLVFNADFSIIPQTAAKKEIDLAALQCPVCGQKSIVAGKAAWGCRFYGQSCNFVLPYVFLDKQLTITQLQVLCKKGETGVIQGFTDNITKQKIGGRLKVTPQGVSLVKN